MIEEPDDALSEETKNDRASLQPDPGVNKREARAYLVLSLLWMVLIFAFSNQAYSGRITEEYLHAANIPVRKLGHISEFGILSLLYLKALACYFPARYKTMVQKVKFARLAFTMAFIYAGLDECHQAFVPGRSSSFTDVLVDATGMIIALGANLYFSWRRAQTDPSAR
jgi:VanZ family protein